MAQVYSPPLVVWGASKGRLVTDLIDTTEMYLKAILELEEEGIAPMRARIAERLEHSGPTVSQTVARMERDGLLSLRDDRQLEFTDEGRLTAVEVMRKHRLAERLLLEVIGLEWEMIHEEACRWEHVMSEQVERRLLDILSDPTTSPFGMPIPGLELLGVPQPLPTPVVSVADAAPGKYRLARIGEPVQLDALLLRQFKELGLLPGVELRVEKNTEWFLVANGQNEGLNLDKSLASHVFVAEIRV
jgi:DtxR family transcriptional regulator, Mn-dependent transcriptional regulator